MKRVMAQAIYSLTFYHGASGSVSDHSVCHLRWTKWHRERDSSKYMARQRIGRFGKGVFYF